MKAILAAALAGFALASAAHAATGVERINPPGPDGKPALILKGAIVPAGYETFYLSGQLADPIDPAKKPASMEDFGDTKTQTLSVLKKIKALLESKGYTMGDAVKMQAFLAADPKSGKIDFAGFNEAFKEYFGSADQPNTVARSTFQVANLVSPFFLVELEVTAVKAPAAAKKK